MATGLTIGRAAILAGVGVETIRFYERRGLIKQPPRPRNGGFRCYDDAVVDRIRFIRQAQELGFSLREIRNLLSLRADPAADCGDVRKQALVKREEVNRKIVQLQQIRIALDELIASCPGGGALRACTIIDALTRAPRTKANSAGSVEHGHSNSAQHRNRTRKGDSVKTATFRIDGMHCDGCARTIEALISTEPGVRKATVSFETREVRILFEPHVVNEDRLAAAIRSAGYSVADESP
jgi:DNA-binding transcriptional MerR regulator/copper chaperone CopZ